MLSHLLLDLDGTLINSSRGIYYSFCLACDRLSLKPPDFSEFCSLIGPPIENIAVSLYPQLDQATLEHFRRIFRQDYDAIRYRMAEWYPDVVDSLTVLSDEWDIDLMIVTNKPTKPAVELIKYSNSYDTFSRVVGIDYRVVHGIGPIFGSKAEALSYVIGSDSFDLSRSAYLGDTMSDREACEACNLTFIAAVYGFYKWLPDQKPQWCLESFRDIQLLLSTMAN